MYSFKSEKAPGVEHLQSPVWGILGEYQENWVGYREFLYEYREK
ncbi:hypothetical protein ACFO4N_12215 [Camelliibacillus cellulosilyticus]|uniref:Uncharacterized protein n=1 Tax=Camelliibacillus cellulosilyticus TaxID=2174486 RepID=A0ABV9GMJ8_9BACL